MRWKFPPLWGPESLGRCESILAVAIPKNAPEKENRSAREENAFDSVVHVRVSSLGLRRTSPLRHNWPHPFDSAHLRGFPWWRCSTRPGIPLFGSRFKRVQAAYSSLPASGAAHGRQDVETEGLKSFCPFCKLHYSHTQRAQSSSAAAVIRLIRARLYSSSLLSSQI